MEKKRVYISDIHMNAGKGFQPERGQYPYEWLGPAEADRFAEFLNHINASDAVKEVIIIGDLFDDWVYPVDVMPPSLEEIINAPINTKIVHALKTMCSNGPVVYLPGNHDMGATAELIATSFPGMIFGETAEYNNVYRSSGLIAEHGNAHAMFTAPDPVTFPETRLPLGYFTCRVEATKARDTGSAKHHYWAYLDDLLETLGPQKLAQSIFEAYLEEAGLNNDTQIIMPASHKMTAPFTAGQIKEKYATLYDRWQDLYGTKIAFKAILADIGFLNNIADRLCKDDATNAIVFGHSHDWKLDKDQWFVDHRIYANCGTWCDQDKPCTWVESQKNREKGQHLIRVMDWNNGEPKVLKRADLPL